MAGESSLVPSSLEEMCPKHGQKQTHKALLVRTSLKHLSASPSISPLRSFTRRRSGREYSRTRVICRVNSGRLVVANAGAQLRTHQWGSRLDGLTLSVVYT